MEIEKCVLVPWPYHAQKYFDHITHKNFILPSCRQKYFLLSHSKQFFYHLNAKISSTSLLCWSIVILKICSVTISSNNTSFWMSVEAAQINKKKLQIYLLAILYGLHKLEQFIKNSSISHTFWSKSNNETFWLDITNTFIIHKTQKHIYNSLNTYFTITVSLLIHRWADII